MIEETDDVHEIAGEMGAFERETESVIPQAGSEAKHMRKVLRVIHCLYQTVV